VFTARRLQLLASYGITEATDLLKLVYGPETAAVATAANQATTKTQKVMRIAALKVCKVRQRVRRKKDTPAEKPETENDADVAVVKDAIATRSGEEVLATKPTNTPQIPAKEKQAPATKPKQPAKPKAKAKPKSATVKKAFKTTTEKAKATKPKKPKPKAAKPKVTKPKPDDA
jgi:hypothetical protein